MSRNCITNPSEYLEEARCSFYDALNDYDLDVAQEILEKVETLPRSEFQQNTLTTMEHDLFMVRHAWGIEEDNTLREKGL